ncbi:MAG: beta-ketoacyl-ACP synthase II [Planctomycetota bacterium]
MANPSRRVVVTGLGAVTPLALGADATFDRLLKKESGIGPIERWDPSAHATRFAGEIQGRIYRPEEHFSRLEARRMDVFSQVGLVAAREAFRDSGLGDGLDPARLGAILGTGIGGIASIIQQQAVLLESGPRRITPFFISNTMANALAGNIAIEFGAQGPCFVTSSACASSGHAIGLAFREIRSGNVDVVITGGAETTTTPLTVAGFNSLRALSTRNEDPQAASRPFDRDRDGFVMGEGAGVLILEALDHALARGARIYCEMAGFGLTDDAFHITAPEKTAGQPIAAIRQALADGGISPDEVDYVNAHGTSTKLNDAMESVALKEALGTENARKTWISSTKSMLGHLVGASAGVEAVVTSLTLHRGVAHPTLNLEQPDLEDGCDLDYIPGDPREKDFRAAISNSFGFGGHNVTLAFRKAP